MQLFLIRHAQSLNNARPQEQRIEDPPLTKLGCEQASRLAENLERFRLTRLITSPFLRTLQTAAFLGDAAGLQPEVRVPLHEKGGCVRGARPEEMEGCAGMSRREIAERFPRFAVADDVHEEGWWRGQPYETEESVISRAENLQLQTRKEFALTDERVAYVTHGDFLRIFLEVNHEESFDAPYNASVTTLDVFAEEIRLSDYNNVEHLPSEMLTR